MDTCPPHPLVLALSGGGAKCAAQAGALEVFEMAGLRVGGLTGASGGALVAVLYAAGLSPRAICDYIANTRLLEVWEFDPKRRGLFGAEKIRARLRGAVGEKTFADLRLPVVVIACDLETGREVRIASGRLEDAMLATMAIPGLFAPLEAGGRTLIDGGAVNPLPVDAARALGPRVVAVDVLHHQPESGIPLQMFETHGPIRYAAELAGRLGLTDMIESLHQTAAIMTRRLSEQMLAAYPPDVLLRPETGHIGLFAFDLAHEAFERGQWAARAQLDQLEWLTRPRSLTAWHAQFMAHRRQARARRKLSALEETYEQQRH